MLAWAKEVLPMACIRPSVYQVILSELAKDTLLLILMRKANKNYNIVRLLVRRGLL